MGLTSLCRNKFRSRFFIFFAVVLFAMTMSLTTVHGGEIEDQVTAGNYVEGEAIVAIRSDDEQVQSQADSPYEVTRLVSVDSSAVKEYAMDDKMQESTEFSVHSDDASASNEIDLCLVSSDTLTTELLLQSLADDPDVIFAEPNYISRLDDNYPLDNTTLADLQESATAQSDTDILGDLTSLQWGNWSNDRTIRTEKMAANPSINVPGFGSTGQSGNMDKPITVALLDTGVYYEHPDLKNVLYHFTPEQQAELGCWEWGYNAVGKGTHGNMCDEDSIKVGHGTHTAGIIGSEWNGSGTSGVASNVRIVCIELADGEGNESLADALAAFAFVNHFNELVPKDERIRVTSNSWSEYSSSRALDAALRDLGERWGIVSVFSAGNDGKNNDRYEKTPSSNADNPYVVVVANTDATDQLNSSRESGSEFGTATVDLAAPGTSILSTTTPDRGFYCPDATSDDDLLYLGFDGPDEPKIKVSQMYHEGKPKIYEEEEIVKENVAVTTNQVHFYGKDCLKIEVDPQYVVDEAAWLTESQMYDLQFDIDLDGTDIGSRLEGAKDLQLGIAYASEKDQSGLIGYVSSNAAFITVNNPVKTESGEETVVEVTRPTASLNYSSNDAEDNQWGVACFTITRDELFDKDYNNGLDPDVTAVNPGKTLSIKVRISLPEGCTTMYMDSIGIGTFTVPYEFATGTSMSCPAVSGAACVLASQGYEGIELASLVRSKVRIPESGALATRTGGVFDFSVAGSPEGGSDDTSPLSPAITDITINESSITITGSNFGTKQGSLTLSRYVVGADLKPVTAHITSWTDDKVTLETEAPLVGILHIVLTNSGGKHDTHMHFASKGDNVYEQDLPFDSSTGDVTIYGDGGGDWETKGPLVGLGGKLYYLPAYCGQTHEYPAYKRMHCFDLKSEKWSDLPELPEWLQDISAVMYQGKIVVEGATMYVTKWGEPTGKFLDGVSQERVYVYDPATDKWTKASSDGMILDQSILNDGGQLKLAGGTVPDPDYPDMPFLSEPAPLMAYDLKTGVGEALCDLPTDFVNPEVAVKDGVILMYSAGTDCAFIRIQDGKAVLLEGAAPDFFLAEGDEPKDGAWGSTIKNPYRCVLAPTIDGFALVGAPEKGGKADTYILRDGKDKFESYAKRSSDDRAYSQAGCTYQGRLFIIASAWFEPNTRLFRATAMDVPEYPGDTPPDEKEKPAEKIVIGDKVVLSKKTFIYNGKIQKPSIKTISGKTLKEGTDYTVTWSNKSSKNVGAYTLTITGIGNYTGSIKATYKINPKGTVIKRLRRTKKAVIVRWKKQPAKMSKSRITGYQIQLATNKKFTKNKKTVTVKGYKKVSRKITKLKTKKKYYVRIRTYKTVGTKRCYSPWSKAK